MPVKSKRGLVKLPVKNDDTDLVAKMKKSHAEFLGLDLLEPDDPILLGTFASGPNQGKAFLKNSGGFRFQSYKLVATETFALNEDDETGAPVPIEVKTIDIGLPKGAAVNKFVAWVAGLTVASQVASVVTPAGTSRGLPAAP